MDYLNWYRQALQLPVENQWTLTGLIPRQDGFELEFKQTDGTQIVRARKVVLATGRDGFGGSYIPELVKKLPTTTDALDALKRLHRYQNFLIRSNTAIRDMHFDGSQVLITTNQGPLSYDFIILGTGFHIDGTLQPELRDVIDQIALWKDHMPQEI